MRFFLAFLLSQAIYAENHLQSGAKLYMEYCAGCHSLQYMRYERLASDLNLHHVSWFEKQVKMTGGTLYSPIVKSMDSKDAVKWFGIDPPDLCLIARQKSPQWLLTYLSSFYSDPTMPFGSNNRLVEEVAMPNVLAPLSTQLNKEAFEVKLHELVDFLVYVSDPSRDERMQLGKYVLIYLFVLFLLLYGAWRLR